MRVSLSPLLLLGITLSATLACSDNTGTSEDSDVLGGAPFGPGGPIIPGPRTGQDTVDPTDGLVFDATGSEDDGGTGGGQDVGTNPLPGEPCEVEGAPCDDGDPCTTDGNCESGQCVPSTFACEDGKPCTDDFCLPGGACQHSLTLGWCQIEGSCFQDGDPNPKSDCEICDAFSSPGAWISTTSEEEASGPQCTLAHDVGEIADSGEKLVLKGQIEELLESDWFTFEAVDLPEPDKCDTFHMRVRLLGPSSTAFRLDVYRGSCSGPDQICAGGRDVEWFTDFNDGEKGECKCAPEGETVDGVNICSDNSARFYVRVHRIEAGDVPCQGYKLEITNGVY